MVLKTKEAFGGLSNMAGGFPLQVNGLRILTSEALYQACRFPHLPEVQRLIIEQASPMTAKMKSKPYRRDSRSDWTQVRVKIMRWCLRVKLARNWGTFSELLLKTGNRPIVEQSRKDDFWGAKEMDERVLVGRNVLGRLLMELREAVKTGDQDSLLRVEPLAIPDFMLDGRPIQMVSADVAESRASIPPPTERCERIATATTGATQASLFDQPASKETPAPYSGSSHEQVAAIADLKPYPAMKDSGVPWLGEVPEHWRQLPGRACYRDKKAPNTGLAETTVLSLSYGQIVVKPAARLHGLVPASFETYQLIEPGEIIIRPTDLQNDWNSLRFGLSQNRGIITSAYMCFQTHDALAREYGHLLLHTYDLKKVFYGLGSGLRQNLDWKDFKYLPCLVPPPEEQAAIVRFLDHADRRIRRYIRVKQKMIKLLEEQKQAIIHRAVTRGLDPNVRLKPSSVEWLGDVPEHWEVKRCRYLFREIDNRSADGSEQHLSMSQRLGLVPSHLIENRTLVSESYAGGKLCEVGDLVLNRLKAHLGVFALADCPGVISPDYTVLRPVDPTGAAYFHSVLRSPACRRELRIRAKGIVAGFWRLYTEDFYDIRLPVPPDEERSVIIEYIRGTMTDIDTTIEEARRGISLLREYRTRLIADVVTGKIDVREAAVRLPDEPAEEEPLDEAEVLAEGGEDSEPTDAEGAPEEAEA